MKWEEQATGDWRLLDEEGEVAGAVVYQDIAGKRIWFSVSRRLKHDPTEGRLTECKRRLERLWDKALEAGA